MAYLINGNGFAPVTAQQDADLYGGILGLPLTVLNVGNKMAAYVAANTDVHILDGEAVCQGRRIHINADDYDSFEIPVGTVGVVAYYIIGYRIYTDTDTGNELAETFVRHMNNATETIPEEVLRDGAAECHVSMYRITLNGLSITNTEALFDIVMTAQELAAAQDELAATDVSLDAKMAIAVDPNRRKALTITNNTIKPDVNGWVTVWSTPQSGITLNPTCRVYADSGSQAPIAEGTGIMYTSIFFVSFPAKAGCTYYLQAYRATVTGARIYY